MRKFLLLAVLCGGCLATVRPPIVERAEPDPIVGEIGCGPSMSILDALYRPADAPAETCPDSER